MLHVRLILAKRYTSSYKEKSFRENWLTDAGVSMAFYLKNFLHVLQCL